MILSSYKNIIKGAKAIGLNIWINPDNTYEINAVLISKKSSQISVIFKDSFNLIEDLRKKISHNFPLYISVDGKGIIHKLINLQTEKSLIDTLIPKAEKNLFFIQEKELIANRSVISFTRKDKLKDISTEFQNAGFDVLNIGLGPFFLREIIGTFDDEFIVHLPYYKFFISDKFIKEFERTCNSQPDFSIEVDNTILESIYLVPFSTGFQHYIVNASFIDGIDVCLNKEDFIFKRFFKITGWAFLIIFFSALLLNFLLFDYLRKKNQSLEYEIDENKVIIEKVERIKAEVNSKEAILKNFNYNECSLFAFYADRLAKKLPDKIALTKLNIFPFQRQSKVIDDFNFLENFIIVNGYTYDSENLNRWIKELKSYVWIKEIHIKSYTDNGSEQAKFELEIILKN